MKRRMISLLLSFAVVMIILGRQLDADAVMNFINMFFYSGMLFLLVSIVSLVVRGGFFDIQFTVFSSSYREKFKKRLEQAEDYRPASERIKENRWRTFIQLTGLTGMILLLLSYLYVYLYYN